VILELKPVNINSFMHKSSKVVREKQLMATKNNGGAVCRSVLTKIFWWLIFHTAETLVKLPIKFTKEWAAIFLKFSQ
jgi:hypothetical protein